MAGGREELSMSCRDADRKNIAVIGSGISGLAAAWLLSQRHRVSPFEAEGRLGGHSNTMTVDGAPVDTGFIVFNEQTYPNLTALFRHLSIATRPAEMSFAVSIDSGALEYSGSGLRGLFAQPCNAVRPRFWAMLRDLRRFYVQAPGDAVRLGAMSLDDYLASAGFGPAFRDDHLYPMAAAIWSTPAAEIGRYPAAAFIRFCETHGLLKLAGRLQWRTVAEGSSAYVRELARPLAERVTIGRRITSIRRAFDHVALRDKSGREERFDHVVIGAHADEALAMLADDATPSERRLLGAFSYTRNEAVLHSDPTLMPRRKTVWSSWNYLCDGAGEDRRLSITYWMNRLQGVRGGPLFVSLNPFREPREDLIHWRGIYHHPVFDVRALAAQEALWSLQGIRRTWFCGAYFGAGFHEDGLQAGLAVAEALGDLRRPWRVAEESGRIRLPGRSLWRIPEPVLA